MFSLFLFVAFFTCVPVYSKMNLTVTIIEPKGSGPEAAIVFAPGESIKSESYKPLVEALQNRSSFKLWVALLDGFIDGKPDLLQLTMVFSDAMEALNKRGYKGRAFIAGHNLGGTLAEAYGEAHNIFLAGTILYGAFIRAVEPIKDYPIPILSLSGDLDGICRITRVLNEFEQHQQNVQSDQSYKYRTPVIVMEGVNHSQFVTGSLPKHVTDNDLAAEVTQAVALDMIANYTDAFIVAAMNNSNTNVTKAKSLLDKAFADTAAMMQPLSAVKALDQNSQMVSEWTISAQQLIIKIDNSSGVEIVNSEDTSANLTSLPKAQKTVTVQTRTKLTMPENPDEMGTPVSPLQLKSRMRSQRYVQLTFPDRSYGEPATCRDINQEAFTLAFFKSSSKAQSRFSSRGRPINFLEDDSFLTSDFEWQVANLRLKYNETGLYVEATRYNTDHFHEPGTLLHQNDCTLLSPFRAMEWIYVDSLKYTTP